MDSHSMSKFTMSSIKRPVIAGTKKWQTQYDTINSSHSDYSKSVVFKGEDFSSSPKQDSLYVHQPEPRNFPSYNQGEEIKLQAFNVDRDTLTADFYSKLQQLKKEHKKTLTLLDDLYEQSDTKFCRHCHSSLGYNHSEWKRKQDCTNHESQTNGGHQYYYQVEDTGNDPMKIPNYKMQPVVRLQVPEKSDSITSVSEHSETADDEDIDEDKSYSVNSVEERITRMWDDFSLYDYTENKVVKSRKDCDYQRPKSAVVPMHKKEWSPIITIPKPFKMTLREEKKKEKRHTSSSMDISKKQIEEEKREEDELNFKQRAREPPAHIYLPLYQEFQERQEQRSRFNKENAVATTVSLQKPFSFAERDEKKLKLKEQKKQKEEARKLRDIKRMAQFEASPVPYSVHDPTISDRIIEEKLYRRIKKKMRSEDLMKSSELPPRMQAHEMIATDRRRAWQQDVEREAAYSFRPQTHSVPDFEALHKHSQFETQRRRAELETTTVQPFNLRTDVRSRQKLENVITLEEERIMEQKKVEKAAKRRKAKNSSFCSVTDTIPARLTDASRLRIETMRRSLQDAERVIQRAKEDEEERKERRRTFAQKVSQKAAGYEATTSSSSKDEKLKQYKKQLRQRQIEYNKFLDDVKQRVEDRPLLFEQHAEKMAKKQAEKRYREILESSGLSDDFVRTKSRLSVSSDDSLHLKSRDLRSTGQDSSSSDSDSEDERRYTGPTAETRHRTPKEVPMTTKSWQESESEEEDERPKTKSIFVASKTKESIPSMRFDGIKKTNAQIPTAGNIWKEFGNSDLSEFEEEGDAQTDRIISRKVVVERNGTSYTTGAATGISSMRANRSELTNGNEKDPEGTEEQEPLASTIWEEANNGGSFLEEHDKRTVVQLSTTTEKRWDERKSDCSNKSEEESKTKDEVTKGSRSGSSSSSSSENNQETKLKELDF